MWSKLLTDLLEKVATSETLAVQDVSSFASVCQSWRSAAAAAKYRRRRHHIPWLLFVDKEDPNSAKFHDLSKNKIVSIPHQPSPSFANRFFIGSADGWLITADEKSELSLLNPLTRQQIDLPPVTTMSNYVFPCGTSSDGTITAYGLKILGRTMRLQADRLRYYLVERAALIMAADSADYLAVIYLRCSSDLAVARSRDKKWTVVNASIQIADIAFCDDGKIYSTNYEGEINSFDFHTHELENLSLVKPELVSYKELKPGKLRHMHYILQSPAGELLLVRRERNDGRDDGGDIFGAQPDNHMHTVKIKVWRIDCTDGHASESNKLVRLRNLGDYAIFLGVNMSFSISSKDFPELRGNCVYLSDEFYESDQSSERRQDVGIFYLKDGSFERILPHGAELYWPSPIWFMPTFA